MPHAVDAMPHAVTGPGAGRSLVVDDVVV